MSQLVKNFSLIGFTIINLLTLLSNQTQTLAQFPKQGIVFAPPSNVRTIPNGQIICSIQSQTTINVYGYDSGWYVTDFCGDRGYIHESQIKLKQSNTLTTEGFILPSGNIYCYSSNSNYLRCEIASGLNPMPPQPESCQLDWGFGLILSHQDSARVLCAGDTIMGENLPTLSYGNNWENAGFKCTSQTAGLTCTNLNGRGFFLSRERWNVF